MIYARSLLAIDRNTRNLELLTQFVEKGGYSVICASNMAEMDRVFADLHLVGLALVDISGFDSSIWSYCERLRASTIPFLVIVPKQNFAIQREILAHGAQGVLVKPLVVKELMGLIANFLRDK